MTRLSVVIPTRDRPESVARLLRALERQYPIDGGFEAVVVADGCTDATVRRLRAGAWRFPCHVLEQPSSGAAAARNCGAALASGSLLLFLDDDVEPEPGVLRAHVALHDAQPDTIGIGYLPPIVEQRGFMGVSLRGWWESMYDGPRRPHHRYTYRDFLSGHFSIPAPVFEALGGFDAGLRCHEDYELGYRAIQAGLQLRLIADAVAWHHDATDIAKALRRKFEEGVADVQLARRYPELVPTLPLAWQPEGGRVARVLRRCAWDYPATGQLLARSLLSMLGSYERWRLRFRWRSRLEALMAHAYWRGVISVVGTRERLREISARDARTVVPDLIIDLANGIEAAEAQLEARRPRSARLVLRSHVVGDIPDSPGAEALRGAHLRWHVARMCGPAYLRAAAAEGLLPAALGGQRTVRQACA
jgi:GT2 family glycosyltransferase